MRFIGPVTPLGDRWLRPHDVDILLEPVIGATEAMIDRVTYLGFEVRVELSLGEGETTWVQTTRGRAEELELREDEIVWLRPAPADFGEAQTPTAAATRPALP